MELALQGLQWETCLVYIDDIIVYASDFDQHIQRVDQVLDRIKQAGMMLRPDKCHMLQTEVVFLGHVVSNTGIRPDPSNYIQNSELAKAQEPKASEAVCGNRVVLPPVCLGLRQDSHTTD